MRDEKGTFPVARFYASLCLYTGGPRRPRGRRAAARRRGRLFRQHTKHRRCRRYALRPHLRRGLRLRGRKRRTCALRTFPARRDGNRKRRGDRLLRWTPSPSFPTAASSACSPRRRSRPSTRKTARPSGRPPSTAFPSTRSTLRAIPRPPAQRSAPLTGKTSSSAARTMPTSPRWTASAPRAISSPAGVMTRAATNFTPSPT